MNAFAIHGALGVQAMASMHVTRAASLAAATGSEWDKARALDAIRSAREAFDEIEAALTETTQQVRAA